ncbi:MAG: hypothetical protein F2934_00975 [Actinobacteria bacterium]|uniref:Unannotated protein n=1 Tax=freshwater metagenome TaxID=449393 RepID=A0A6J6UDI4_9ZZZZ|nr:hypothetical protein [Actinomycetota bacterium]MSY12428.1 hypothetical protein [Actinomycetota bacterium]MSZ04180.1 hypothetical protein [Actinomycetota bacterium]MTB05683.1 hypothetical protein [Actinomycetota bacterium]
MSGITDDQLSEDLLPGTEALDPGETTPDAAPRKQRSLRRRALRYTALVVAALLIPVSISCIRALTGPGYDSAAARTVQWARDHHMGSFVDWAERHWFDKNQAKVGGEPDPNTVGANIAGAVAVPTTVPSTTAVPSPTSAPTDTGTATGLSSAVPTTSTTDGVLRRLPPPTPLTSPSPTPFRGEGRWTGFGPLIEGEPGAYATTVRPDVEHSSISIGVVWFDPAAVRFRLFPGDNSPSRPWDRPPYVPVPDRKSLLAAFAGGFRLNESNGGMLLGGKEIRPMRVGAATFAFGLDGKPLLGNWGVEVPLNGTYDSVRQNLDLIVDDGVMNPLLETDPNNQWGFTGPNNNSFVWRSGVGILADGAIVWVGGNGLSVVSLAKVFVRIGAARAMQLEINREWVQLNTYTLTPEGKIFGKRLLTGMRGPDNRWLDRDTRDFVAVFGRSELQP